MAKGGGAGAGEIPPPLELACLTVLWKRGEADVGEVREAMHESRPLAYTTVMTVLERLAAKGMVTRQKSGRSFRYAPARNREEIRALAVAQLIDQFFDGSIAEFGRYLRAMPLGGAAPLGLDLAAFVESDGRDPLLPSREPAETPPLPPAGHASTLDETLL
ncbi:MAG: BlaI/MecI/CopY family transcriptional regulator [Bryobacterales bacterium]|nr:BlaI/MecI/CopY family transcriptional regulator [Bryobacterales bacterium]